MSTRKLEKLLKNLLRGKVLFLIDLTNEKNGVLWWCKRRVEEKREEKKMKVMNIDNPEKFFEVINECKGTVELVTKEGDRLNLKSQLTKYVALTKLFADNAIPEMELVAHDPEDVNRLLAYMVNSK